MGCAKTAESIELPFRMVHGMDPGNHVLCGYARWCQLETGTVEWLCAAALNGKMQCILRLLSAGFTARVARMYRFYLVCVCLSGSQKLIISSLHHILHFPGGGVGPIIRHVHLSVRPGPGVCLGPFAHLTDFVQVLITFKHCLVMLTKKHISHLPITYIPLTHTPLAVAVCAIQPWADSSVVCECGNRTRRAPV